MKIKYEFLTGEKVEVEVDDEIGMLIRKSRIRESSYERKTRRHCYSLDAADEKSKWYQAVDYTEDPFIRDDEEEEWTALIKKMDAAFSKLTDKQQDLLRYIFWESRSQAEYAEEHKLDPSTVSKRYAAAMKKLKNNM